MKRSSTPSLILIFGWPLVNVAIVFAIVKINNLFLLSQAYTLLFGVAVPLLLLLAFWGLTLSSKNKPRSLILPGIASIVILLCGGFHFFNSTISAASV